MVNTDVLSSLNLARIALENAEVAYRYDDTTLFAGWIEEAKSDIASALIHNRDDHKGRKMYKDNIVRHYANHQLYRIITSEGIDCESKEPKVYYQNIITLQMYDRTRENFFATVDCNGKKVRRFTPVATVEYEHHYLCQCGKCKSKLPILATRCLDSDRTYCTNLQDGSRVDMVFGLYETNKDIAKSISAFFEHVRGDNLPVAVDKKDW